MKTLKNILSFALALILALSLSVSVSFAENTGTIKITGPIVGQTYSAYKLFDLSQSGSNYSYTIKNKITTSDGTEIDNPWKTAIETWSNLSENGSGAYLYFTDSNIENTSYVSFTSGFSAEALAKYLNENMPAENISPASQITAADNNIVDNVLTISGLEPGYYFVTSSLGSICSLSTTNTTAEIKEKNSEPKIEKTITNADDATGTIKNSALGKDEEFVLTITTGKGMTSYIVHDLMTDGLTFEHNGSFTVTLNGAVVENNANANYTISTGLTGAYDIFKNDGITDLTEANVAKFQYFTITFTEDFINKSLSKEGGDKIVIKYKAHLNKDAIVNNSDRISETNYVKLQYGTTFSALDSAILESVSVDFVKHDGIPISGSTNYQILEGAHFKLYSDSNYTNEIKLVESKVCNEKNRNCYRLMCSVDDAGTTPVEYIEAGYFTIHGLAPGTYYLKEIKAPDGYNPIAEEITVTNADGTVTTKRGGEFSVGTQDRYIIGDGAIDLTAMTYGGNGGVSIPNYRGNEMPATGGMGTTIIYVAGAILAVGAGILLITKRRMRSN